MMSEFSGILDIWTLGIESVALGRIPTPKDFFPGQPTVETVTIRITLERLGPVSTNEDDQAG
jgi:hypothetical protein